MDRRIVFFSVMVFTLLSTLLVFAIGLVTGQTLLTAVIYALATMWLMGISSQILLQHLYESVVRPLENERLDEELAKAKLDVNLEDIEEIDQVIQLEKEVGRQAQMAMKGQSPVRSKASGG
ncbi:MAG: hypothetical protein KDK78_02050 [Chlamydiia bacterium]|nr:hypothetical protein [Chlamydiia bacterium]